MKDGTELAGAKQACAFFKGQFTPGEYSSVMLYSTDLSDVQSIRYYNSWLCQAQQAEPSTHTSVGGHLCRKLWQELQAVTSSPASADRAL